MSSSWPASSSSGDTHGPSPERWPAGERSAAIPASYAEKAMASLLDLHRELMDEKERRIELTERMATKEQQLAEMAGYVKLLEERLFRANEERAERDWAAVQERDASGAPAAPLITQPSAPLPAEEPVGALDSTEPLSPEPRPRNAGWRVW